MKEQEIKHFSDKRNNLKANSTIPQLQKSQMWISLNT